MAPTPNFPLFLTNLVVTWALFGLIWTIQLVHYPSFRYIDDFSAFHQHHTSSITLIVMPLMLLELMTSAWLAWQMHFQLTWILLLLLVLFIWGITFFWAIPVHQALSQEVTPAGITELILANWPRTLLWSAKAGWLSWLAYGFWYTRT
ncbi:MAG: hypothetical protein AAF840_11910 [Bacteroidota bacterium]